MSTFNISDYYVIPRVETSGRYDEIVGYDLISKDSFEEIDYRECYGDYGQQNELDEEGWTDEDGEEIEATVLAYNYWDGHNWATLYADFGDIDPAGEFETIGMQDERDDKIRACIENAVRLAKKEGKTEIGFGEWGAILDDGTKVILENQCQAHWEDYSVVFLADENEIQDRIRKAQSADIDAGC